MYMVCPPVTPLCVGRGMTTATYKADSVHVGHEVQSTDMDMAWLSSGIISDPEIELLNPILARPLKRYLLFAIIAVIEETSSLLKIYSYIQLGLLIVEYLSTCS